MRDERGRAAVAGWLASTDAMTDDKKTRKNDRKERTTMRRLLLMRGAPGCGKTTWVRRTGLEAQVVSADRFRELVYPRAMTLDGDTSLLGGAERTVWRMVLEAAEVRMSRGATVVVDATNLGAREQNRWRELAVRYQYRVGLVDCQEGVSDDELRRRNAARGPDRLDEAALERMLQRAHEVVVVEGVERVSAHDPAAVARFFSYPGTAGDRPGAPATGSDLVTADDVMLTAPGVSVIGDVQSCSNALAQALADTPQDHVVVLAGDLFDRGPDALGVFEQVTALDPARVVLVQGNHETRMLELIRGTGGRPPAQTRTSHEQVTARYRDRDILRLLARSVPLCTFRVHGAATACVVTHGGVTQAALERALSGRRAGCGLARLVDWEGVHGTSERGQVYAGRSTYDHVGESLVLDGGRVVQLHGHRNGGRDSQPAPAGAVPGVWNLENRVEDGGTLRVARVRAGEGGALEVRVQEYREHQAGDGQQPAGAQDAGADCPKAPDGSAGRRGSAAGDQSDPGAAGEATHDAAHGSNGGTASSPTGSTASSPTRDAAEDAAGEAATDVVARLDAHPGIRRRETGEGVVSYTFTRQVFHKGSWDGLTTTARGLFVRDGKVVGRGFDKFFNLGERGTTLDDLTYPVQVTRKVNGFLGIMLALDGGLRVWSKAGDTGYGRAAAQAVEQALPGQARQRLVAFLAGHDVSVALEVTLASDPHLVDESHRPGVTALAVIDNSFAFRRRDELMDELAGLGLARVEVLATASCRAELDQVLHADALASGERPVEGVVLTDARQHMVKVKYDQYRARRRLRTALGHLYAGRREQLPADLAHVQAALGDDPVATIAGHVVRTPGGGTGIDVPGLLDHLGLTHV